MQDKRNRFRWALLLSSCLALPAMASEPLLEETQQAQQRQAELQARIDAADEETRKRLETLRQARREARQLEAYNAELEPLVERQAETLARRERAIETLEYTRDALPPLMRSLVSRLERFVDQDLPFLHAERLSRVESLEAMLSDSQLSTSDKLDRVLSAWRAELDYGQEMDAWSGRLDTDTPLDVDFLRIGRVGYYYLTPDGRRGGVWKSGASEWQSLDDDALKELRKGIRIARDQRAPELLALPVSIEVTEATGEESAS
ncbi:DUF3450 domain-containing protein [Litchfieldella xinjiangensis]|uniref:DUF3450 domain-containing protein n=1 Tax=Litchfieldella xinjiangensis TaxID=1166948 RepID=UPI000AED2145|nr:DUF3450 domain-containing protein [Halomonas xinjiangensis]